MANTISKSIHELLLRGVAIPAHPLALDMSRKLDFAHAGRLESENAHGAAMAEINRLEGEIHLHGLERLER